MSEQLQWISNAGTTILLDGSDPNGYFLNLVGRAGLGAPGHDFIEQDIPLQPGARLRQVLAQVREVQVPLLIRGNTEGVLMQSHRYLRSAMNPIIGDGQLRYIAADNVTRRLKCRLESGIELDESQGNRGPGFVVAPLVFRADDPYWYDDLPTINNYAAGTTSFFPFLPMVLSGGSVLSSFSVNNLGDIECWPIWVITGPGTNPTFTNNTTGKSITLTATLLSTDIWTINTTPGVKSITNQSGTNEYAALATSSSLFSLVPGINSISISMTGTSGASSIQLQYYQRWLGV